MAKIKIDREEFRLRLIAARRRNNIETVSYIEPDHIYAVITARGSGGFGYNVSELWGVKHIYLGWGWSDPKFNWLPHMRKWFRSWKRPVIYTLHSDERLVPVWGRLGFRVTGLILPHSELTVNGLPMDTWEMERKDS